MYEINKMLLATNDTRPSHQGELRAVLLASQLGLDAFEMLTLKRASSPFGRATTEFSHIEVRGATFTAWLDGMRRPVRVPDDLCMLERIWTSRPGSAAETVVELARERAADLTVLAPYRRNALLELLAPSDSREVLRRSRNSLLLVHSEPRDVYRKVLVGVDFSAEAYAAARVALMLAPGARFTFVHAYRLPDEGLMRELELPPALIGSYLARGCQAAWERLEDWIGTLGPGGQKRTGAVHSGYPAPMINACARSIGADLIVVGRQGRSRASRHGLGEVARRLGNQAACDVLIGPALPGMPSARTAAARMVGMASGAACAAQR